MIGECLEEKSLFGVVRSQEEGVAQIGCTAEIVAVTKNYDDGRMDIVTQGRERFELLELNHDRSFLRGEVVLIADEPDKPEPQELARAVQLHQEILALAGAQQDLAADSGCPLSFQMAGSLPLDLDFKQALLSMRSENERIQAISKYFETVRRAVVARHKASGNGHAH
jgi:Lon protease-like protein